MTTNRKRLLMCLIMTLSGSVMAEWDRYFDGSNGDVFFYDRNRIQKEKNLINVWNRVRYKTSMMGAESYQSHIRIDCTDYSETTLQGTFYIDDKWTLPAMATDTKRKTKTDISGNDALEALAKLFH